MDAAARSYGAGGPSDRALPSAAPGPRGFFVAAIPLGRVPMAPSCT